MRAHPLLPPSQPWVGQSCSQPTMRLHDRAEARFAQKIASSSRSDEIASGAALFGMMKRPLPPDSSWPQARQGEQPLFLLGV